MGRKMTTHHRKPKAHGGTDEPSNLTSISDKKHKAWHCLFGTKAIYQIIRELNDVYIDPDYRFILTEKEKLNPKQLNLRL